MNNQDSLLRSIDLLINERMSKLKFNRYIDGIIKEVQLDNKYLVTLDGEDYIIKARDGLTLALNDIVYVCVINNNFNRKYIIDKRVV